MKFASEREILLANKPSEIFSMNLDTLEDEKEKYVELFKPTEYNQIKNFTITKKIILLYRQAREILETGRVNYIGNLPIGIPDKFSHYHYDEYKTKLGSTYVSEKYVIYLIKNEYESYYRNYIEKTETYPKIDRKTWDNMKRMVPKVVQHFDNPAGDFIIIVEKSPHMYLLREIVDYFGGRLAPEYVASILTRLYYFVSYMSLIDLTHNAITLDNLFFAPGHFVEEGTKASEDDMRIIGVLGGWFFTTYTYEKINGMPKEVYEVIPKIAKSIGYSSYQVDCAAIKRLGRELLGDVTGKNLGDTPKPLKDWLNDNSVSENAYEEYQNWNKAIYKSFGKRKFVEMDVSL